MFLLEFKLFKLDTGRAIYLDELLISYTYAGKLEGGISARGNQSTLEYLKTRGIRLWGSGPRLVLGLDSHMANISQELPRFTFAGVFRSSPIRDKNKNVSQLILIWLARDLEPIFTESVLSEIRRLNWDELAEDRLLTP